MSISERDRFASVAEFWEEITAHATESHDVPHIITREAVNMPLRLPQPLTVTEQELSPITPLPAVPARSFSIRTMLFSLLAILALTTWIIGTAVIFAWLGHNHAPVPALSNLQISPKHGILIAPPFAPSQYPLLATVYSGTIGDIVAKESTPMFLSNLQQKQGSMNGFFHGLGLAGPFTGTVTKTGRLQFTVPLQNGTSTLAFVGQIKVGGDIEGSYQVLDQHGQHTGDSGVWNAQPNI